MSPTLLIILSVIALFLVFRIRRWFVQRSVKQYTPAEAQQSPNKIFLDVRTGAERAQGSIRGSIHIPLHELSRRINELRPHMNREIICYCQSGSRSIAASSILQRHGYTVANLKGGIAEWNFQNLR